MCASFKDVEHPCQQCGTTVEDGRPFCPQCHAPQIHVQVAIPETGVVAGLNPVPDDSSPVTVGSAHSDRPVLSRKTIDSRIAVRAALKAGVLGVFVGAIPFIGIVLTGALAVFFYRRKSGFVLPAALGARLGGAAGIVVFAISALLTIAVIALHAQQQCIDLMITMLQRFGANTSDPQIRAGIQNLFTVSGQAVSFFSALVFASVGGALASFFLRPRKPQG
jgi:hypothetical protein